MKRELLKGHLDLLLLAVLAKGPQHGYAIIEALRDQSGGTFDLPEGTVYPALHRLEAAGFAASSWAEGATRRRRIYEISGPGREALAQQHSDWERFAGAVREIVSSSSVVAV